MTESLTTQDAGVGVVPDHVPPELVHPLDQWNGADFLANPIGYWDDIRPTTRVFWSPLHGGFWCLTRYADIHEVFQRTEDFSSRLTNIPGRKVRLLPISLDPPEHRSYRRVLNRPFAPPRIEQLGVKIEHRANELIDSFIDRGECDFMAEFAVKLPTQIFCELLGLPPEEMDQFLEWNNTILHVHGDAEGQARQTKANEELSAYLSQFIAGRGEGPADDLVRTLLAADVDGRPMAHEEALGMVYLLFMAGLDTVTAALGWSWQFLAEHPDHRQQIVDDPELIPSAIEELLRYYSFLEDSRTITRDLEFAGVTMKEGDRIMLPTSSADRDEEQFPDPHTVDFQRDPNRHLIFAAGPHRCLGSHLARAEVRIAMEAWHRRIPDYRIREGAQVHYHGGAVIGLDNLPIEFPAG
jgi:cytochrome P450